MMRQPLPQPTALTQPFWDAARHGRLAVQRCLGCTALRHYPQPLCPHCHCDRHDWTTLRGSGVIYSYTVTHHTVAPYWSERVPYVVATIELDEGIRMISDLDEPAERVAIGVAVTVFFDDVGDGLVLPRFRVIDDANHKPHPRGDST